jgi:uncharacterized protein YbjT (DUF2867 family)
VTLVIAGASGFVGRALAAHLAAAGNEVTALVRTPGSAPEEAREVTVDLTDARATAASVLGARAAYYLVHSMASGTAFPELDLRLATTFGQACADAAIERIVYVGGLGAAPSSAHLTSRQEVGTALAAAGVPVVELRAAVVFGPGGISFEMVRYLTERLPMMVCPRWVRTRIQPIALRDLLAYLEQSLQVPSGVYEVGGNDVTTYRSMIEVYGEVRGLRRRRIVDIPWLTPQLSSYWVDLVTPVDRKVSHALIESLVTEVVVTDPAPAAAAFPVAPLGVREAMRVALADQEEAVTRTLFERTSGLSDGIYTFTTELTIPDGRAGAVAADLHRIGGRFGWYGSAPGWVLRLLLGRLVGERLRRHRPPAIEHGALVDWWQVSRAEPDELVLRSVGWFPGEAWLGYRVEDDRLHQVAAFRPRGISGFLYWKLLTPVHRIAFARMARRRLRG